jgi:predicted transcriptional regulator
LYITPAKGSKTEKITLKIDSSFAERLQALEQKTGLKKSVIVRDSVQLYDFIKRKFNDNNVSFFIGGTPIVSI